MIQEILNFIWLLILFGIFWVIGVIGHELFHGLACFLQGCKFSVEIWWFDLTKKIKFPSMRCNPIGTLKDDDMFYYLGGIGIGGLFAILSLPFYFLYMPLFITLFLVGMANFLYGLYEGMFIKKLDNDEYMKWHYVIYLLVIVLGIILIRNPIINYIW